MTSQKPSLILVIFALFCSEIANLILAPTIVYYLGYVDYCHQINVLWSISQSINVKFVGRHYTTRPGAPTVVSGKHDKKYILELFFECTGVSNVMEAGRKSVPGGWRTVVVHLGTTLSS